jgi:hypothetical protein
MFGRRKRKVVSIPEDHDGIVLKGIELADRIEEMAEANRKRRWKTGFVLGMFGVVHVGWGFMAADPLFSAGLILNYGLIFSGYAWYHGRLRKKIEGKQREFEALTSTHTHLLP